MCKVNSQILGSAGCQLQSACSRERMTYSLAEARYTSREK